MRKTSKQHAAFNRHVSREARLARNLALAKRLRPESKDELRAQAEQACAVHAVERIAPAAPPDGQPRQQLGGRSFFKGKRAREG